MGLFFYNNAKREFDEGNERERERAFKLSSSCFWLHVSLFFFLVFLLDLSMETVGKLILSRPEVLH